MSTYPLMAGAALVLIGLAGCGTLGADLAMDAPRIDLGDSLIVVSARTKRTNSGVPLRSYTCGRRVMVCEGGGPRMTCRCVGR